MKSNQYNDNLYGIYFCKNKNYEVYDFCFLKNENGFAKIPLGEILFYIIESVDFLSNMIKKWIHQNLMIIFLTRNIT